MLLPIQSKAMPRYVVQSVADLAPTTLTPVDINNRGQIAAQAYQHPIHQAFICFHGDFSIINLIAGRTWALPYGISPSGCVVGSSGARWGLAEAFVWQDGAMSDLPSIAGTIASHAMAMNSLGQIVGQREDDWLRIHACIWEEWGPRDLGELAGAKESWARGINNAGQVAGFSGVANSPYVHAVIWQASDITDLGTLPGTVSSEARAINGTGWVVGDCFTANSADQPSLKAFLWRNGEMVDLGSLWGGFSAATDVNAKGQVVGRSFVLVAEISPPTMQKPGALSRLPDLNQHAFLWQDGVMVDLNQCIPSKSGWTLLSAEAINDFGQIVGLGCVGQDPQGFLLTPIVTVALDIRPGDHDNSVNLKSHGRIAVAVLTTDDFDAADIDPATVEFATAKPERWHLEDVNSDGRLDMVFHFRIQNLHLISSSTEATLMGAIRGGQNYIEGKDSVSVVGIGH